MYSKEDYLGPTMGDNDLCEPGGTLGDLSHNSGGFFSGTTSQGRDDLISQLRYKCLEFLLQQVNQLTHQVYTLDDLGLLDNHLHSNKQVSSQVVMETESQFCIPPFSIEKGILKPQSL